MKKFLKRIGIFSLCILLVLIIMIATIIGSGFFSLRRRPAQLPDLSDGDSWYWQEDGTFIADGVAYVPRKNLFTALAIGVGTSDEREASGYTNGLGVADAFILAVLDSSCDHITLLSIPRDTQTMISWCDETGKPTQEMFGHLALQYTYGGSTHEMCSQNTVTSVSKLLHNTGIGAWFTLDMDSIVQMVDAMGGIAITVPDDPYYCAYTGYTPGQWVLLDGPAALQFVQYRDTNVFGSCEMRVERQKVFVDALLDWILQGLKKYPLHVPHLYSAMQDYYYTDLKFNEILALGYSALGMHVSDISMQTLPGAVQSGAFYEEYLPNEQESRQLLLNLFYQPAT